MKRVTMSLLAGLLMSATASAAQPTQPPAGGAPGAPSKPDAAAAHHRARLEKKFDDRRADLEKKRREHEARPAGGMGDKAPAMPPHMAGKGPADGSGPAAGGPPAPMGDHPGTTGERPAPTGDHAGPKGDRPDRPECAGADRKGEARGRAADRKDEARARGHELQHGGGHGRNG